MTNTPRMIILRTEKVLPGNGQLPYPRQSEKIGRLSRENCGGQSFLFCLLSMYCNKPSPSQALPRQLSQGESQAVMFVAKVLGIMRKCPAVPLPLPLGEVSPQVTERARTVSSAAKVFKCNEKPCSRCRCACTRPEKGIRRTVDWKIRACNCPRPVGK